MPRHTLTLATALAVTLAALAPEARAADACIPPKVIDALADCTAILAQPAPPAVSPPPASPGPSKGRSRRAMNLAPRELDAAEQAQEEQAHRVVCQGKPAPGDAKARERYAEAQYTRAWVLFQANRFQESAALFGAIARDFSDTPDGILAAQLCLESLNVLGARFDTPGCFDDMARDVPVFLELYCKDDKAAVNAERCDVLVLIQRDILRLQADDRVKAADRKGQGGDADYEAAADLYLSIWTRYGKDACEAQRPGCERSEEILYNAARAYQAAHLPSKAMAARRLLVDPRYHLQNSEPAIKAVYAIGVAYQAMGIYDEAASWYERFALANPRKDKAPEALKDAVVLRLALGQIDRATSDADAFNKQYGMSKPAETAQVAYAIGQHMLDGGDAGGAKLRLEGAMSMIDRNATIDVQVRAHGALARALAALGKAPAAGAEYARVKAFYRDPAAVAAKLAGNEDGGIRALVAVLATVGEAMFFFAEEKRRAAEAIHLPVYAGTGRAGDIKGYMEDVLQKWIIERRRAIEEAEKAYVEIYALQPAAPPWWVVRAFAQVAKMHGDLAAELAAAPTPRGWKTQGPSPWGAPWEAILARWKGGLDTVGAPLWQRAKAAHKSCVTTAVKFDYGDEESRGCADWLSRVYPAEFPRLDELMDRPLHRAFGIELAPAPGYVGR
ncbi:MAG: hypothetical protein U0359_09770 [Byssovorax sp.]